MKVSLTPELERFVETELKNGVYQTASDVIRAGLRRLKADKERSPAFPKTSEELEASLLQSLKQFDRGKGVDGEEAFRRLLYSSI